MFAGVSLHEVTSGLRGWGFDSDGGRTAQRLHYERGAFVVQVCSLSAPVPGKAVGALTAQRLDYKRTNGARLAGAGFSPFAFRARGGWVRTA